MAQKDADDRLTHRVEKKTFAELLRHVRHWRNALAPLAHQTNVGQFACGSSRTPQGAVRFYALGTFGGSREHTLLFCDVMDNGDDVGRTSDDADQAMEQFDQNLEWRPLLTVAQDSTLFRGLVTKEEQLLRERMRCMTRGIVSYDFEANSGTFVFSATGKLYRCTDDLTSILVSPSLMETPWRSGAPLDPKICPSNPRLTAHVSNNDVHVQADNVGKRATFASASHDGVKQAGIPPFIIEEEFNRFTGYWWCPVEDNNTYYVLYEESDLSSVLELGISTQLTRTGGIELMRYPKTGTENAAWTLKILKISLQMSDSDGKKIVTDIEVEDLQLDGSFRELLPWAEYLVQAGWVPNGKGIWFQVMSRIQDRIMLYYAPLTSFKPVPDIRVPFFSAVESMEDLTKLESQPRVTPSTSATLVPLYEECTPGTWINYHDNLQLLSTTTDEEAEYLWISGKSGFYHLYLIKSNLQPSGGNSDIPSVIRETQVTSGEWDVRRKSRAHVDEEKGLVFFLGNKHSPLELHIYVTSLRRPGPVRTLTAIGHSHGCQRNGAAFCLSSDKRLLMTYRSCVNSPGECVIYSLTYAADDSLPTGHLLHRINKATIDSLIGQSQEITSDISCVPDAYSYDSPRTGFRHYAYLFKPTNCEPNTKYPTVLYVYAGPEMQIVQNVWMGSSGFQKYTSLGYAVVMIDGRGSANRGVHFELSLKHSLGSNEIADQIEILTDVAERSGVVDMQRLAIIGWSYGGYVSLLGLAQRPDVFKVAIAGAPVTSWFMYDTAYTERYMGMPQENVESYIRASVLSQAGKFPDETGRLLILHGMSDDNVHFQHTSELINALISADKPYQLQVFPNERHALRTAETNEHMDATILDFLQRNL